MLLLLRIQLLHLEHIVEPLPRNQAQPRGERPGRDGDRKLLLLVTPQQLLLPRHGRHLLRLHHLLLLQDLGMQRHHPRDPKRRHRRTGGTPRLEVELVGADHGRVGEERAVRGRADVVGELQFGAVEVGLHLLELVLEDGDVADATVDRVPEPRLRLVRQRVHRLLPLAGAQVVEELRDVARPEHPVDVGELRRVLRREVGREHAPLRALPPQELARRARRVLRHRFPLNSQGTRININYIRVRVPFHQ